MGALGLIRDLAIVLTVAGASGWLCRRFGLSVVVGYLVAGMLVGPHTPPFQLITDLNRVQTLGQLGLVFLIFSIGLGLSLGRLQRLGLSVMLATGIGALIMLQVSRLFGAAFGWTSTESLFLGSMLVVSSSAIIAKVLEELNATHEREGQLALGITVLEDVVAIAMLTVLTSLAQAGTQEQPSLGPTALKLAAFVVALALVSLAVVPRLLLRVTRSAGDELRNVLMTALLMTAAIAAAGAGFSLALGAFVLGAIVAGSRLRREIEHAFDTFRHVFGAVFFVSIGVLFDFRVLAEAWPYVLAVTLLVLVARPLAVSTGLLAVGNPQHTSLRAGLSVLPIGEFSLVMAQLGVSSKLVPPRFYAIAVGICLTTSLLAPPMTRRSDAISDWLVARQPRFLHAWIAFYQDRLSELHGRGAASRVLTLTKKRLMQVGVQFLFLTALLLVWRPVLTWLEGLSGGAAQVPEWLQLVYWGGFALVLAAPLVALWRNAEAILMIVADATTPGTPGVHPLVFGALKAVAAALLFLWVVSLLPLYLASFPVLALMGGVLLVALALFSRALVRWHLRLELEVRSQLRTASSPAASAGLSLPILERPEWPMEVNEVELPSHSQHAGKRISELALRTHAGCSIVGIDRQGFVMTNPAGDERLYPGDRLLVLGTESQLAQGEALLTATEEALTESSAFSELTTESVDVPPAGPAEGVALQDLDLARRFGVQVCGISRDGVRRIMPSAHDRVHPGDQLLLLGTHDRITECRDWFDQGLAPAGPTPGAPA